MIEDEGTDPDLEAELGFEPAAAVSGQEPAARPSAGRGLRLRSRLRRRLSAFAILFAALTSVSGAYAAFASSSGAAGSAGTAASIAQGRQLYEVTCIACHGANLQGVQGRGVSLIGVGGAAAYFQVSTGRMPLAQQGPQANRKTPKFNEQQTLAIAAFVQSIGGGPAIPSQPLRGDAGTIAEGGELFRVNCAQCHGVTGHGAPLSAGKGAPSLYNASDRQITAAMLTGPESMPVFSNNELTPPQKRAIVAYLDMLKHTADPGGNGIARIGPVSEAVVIWFAGVGALMVAILWIGAKSQ